MEQTTEKYKEEFKKPVVVGRSGQVPRKIQNLAVEEKEHKSIENSEGEHKSSIDAAVVPYEEPSWASIPDSVSGYKLAVLKNGSIIESIKLENKSFWVIGRLPMCDVPMQHPTISRYHAILQYRNTPKDCSGFYIYDLGSTHGTYLNKNKLVSKVYAPVRVGHMIQLGCSTRKYILEGPEEDSELESEFTISELKQQRAEELRQRDEEKQKNVQKLRKKEEAGIDWGMGEDAEEETDLSVNPFAQTNNEELYISDPKKALRGYFEREGLDLEYDCTEQGMGQFLCKVELPVDDEMGRPIHAEVLQKGKKKEVVIQCALEACRILDRYGLLRQATHESKKRKAKNWEDNDYYDSDDDTFLDRTGSVEKKRENRMKHQQPEKAQTYESLTEKERDICKEISDLETMIETTQNLSREHNIEQNEIDSLDSFMSQLNDIKADKQALNKLKSRLKQLKQERENTVKLINIVKPASMPPLVISDENRSLENNKILPIFGKLKKPKLQISTKITNPSTSSTLDSHEEETEETELQPDSDASKSSQELTYDVALSISKTKFDKKNSNIRDSAQEKDPEIVTKSEEDKTALNVKGKKESKTTNKTKQKQQTNDELRAKYGDIESEDYEMWLPPSGQSGDGRTSLNDRLGY